MIVTKGFKTGLGLIGILFGMGGVAGVAHATPTILWKSGVSCKNIGVTTNDISQLTAGLWVEWEGGGYTNLKENTFIGDKSLDWVCYKK